MNITIVQNLTWTIHLYMYVRDVFTLHNIRKYFVNFRIKSIWFKLQTLTANEETLAWRVYIHGTRNEQWNVHDRSEFTFAFFGFRMRIRRSRIPTRKSRRTGFSAVRLAAGTRVPESIHASPRNTDRGHALLRETKRENERAERRERHS